MASIQVLNVFLSAAYLHDGSVNGYQRTTAPILMANTVGGYMPGPADAPQRMAWPTNATTIQQALKRGYVVVAAGIRGRTMLDESGQRVGQAPALVWFSKFIATLFLMTQASSAALAVAVMLDPVSSGAALIGTTAQFVGFTIMSFRQIGC